MACDVKSSSSSGRQQYQQLGAGHIGAFVFGCTVGHATAHGLQYQEQQQQVAQQHQQLGAGRTGALGFGCAVGHATAHGLQQRQWRGRQQILT
jgi:hypothetical protein